MNDTVCRRLRIHGLVQGVGFRYSMQAEALRLGISGWVRNRRDGSVEAVVSGPQGSVEAIVAWARRGPRSARVDRFEIAPEDGSFGSFEQQPTA